ncbi:MAG: acyltransferase [Polyangiales bacterium]
MMAAMYPSRESAERAPVERDNNFDSLRLLAALSVLWSHTVPLTQGSERNELMFRWSGGQTTTGTVAVFVFFSISGYLITRSFERASSPWSYVRARVLRIMPGLLAVLFACALVLGPLETTLPLRSYITSSEPYRYLLVQGSFYSGWLNELPGVWSDNPTLGINGSIWTLKYEVELYGLVLLLGLLGALRREVVLALYVLVLASLVLHPGAPGTADKLPDPNAHLDVGAAFLAGAALYLWRVPMRAGVALACALATAWLCHAGYMLIAQRTVLPYLVLYLCLGVPALPRPRSDISYGLYLWGYPLSQLIVAHHPGLRWWALAMIVTPLALLAGWLSWQCIEKPALRCKALTFRRSPALSRSGFDLRSY